MAHLQLLMESREPLRDVLMRWTGEKQNLLLLVSGEPRLDSRGKFRGYWGVARDVTAEHRARAALLDTELRYRDLFRRTPTPMVLLSFMSESRRLHNRRMKDELRLRLRYPTVAEGLRAPAGVLNPAPR